MNTTADDLHLELLRNAILIQMESAYPSFVTAFAIGDGVRLLGHSSQPQSLNKEIHYLIDKGLVTYADHPLNKRTIRYRITASGRDYLESQGLA